MTKEELVKDIEKLEREIGECEDNGDYAGARFLVPILISREKELDSLE